MKSNEPENPKRDFEWELINKDGSKRFVEVSVSLMRNEKGAAKGILRPLPGTLPNESRLKRNQKSSRTDDAGQQDGWLWGHWFKLWPTRLTIPIILLCLIRLITGGMGK